jgi:uncharacterized membrane protein
MQENSSFYLFGNRMASGKRRRQDEERNLAPFVNSALPQGHTRSIEITQARLTTGPLPDPETLAKYNQIVPDGANRIIVMAEKQSAIVRIWRDG